MVNISTLAVFALVPLVANAMPSSSVGLSARSEKFSFEKWANGIIADPNGDHLSAREALDAAHQDHSLATRAAGDITCNHLEGKETNSPDVVECINALAARGGDNCRAEYTGSSVLAEHGNAQIVSVAGVQGGVDASCQEIGAFAGKMMDRCWRSDNTIQAIGYPKDGYALHIASK